MREVNASEQHDEAVSIEEALENERDEEDWLYTRTALTPVAPAPVHERVNRVLG